MKVAVDIAVAVDLAPLQQTQDAPDPLDNVPEAKILDHRIRIDGNVPRALLR